MVDQEARALDELDTFTSAEPEETLALMSDELFDWVDLDEPLA